MLVLVLPQRRKVCKFFFAVRVVARVSSMLHLIFWGSNWFISDFVAARNFLNMDRNRFGFLVGFGLL